MAKKSTGMPLETVSPPKRMGNSKGKSQGPSFMQAFGGLIDGAFAAKTGTKVPKESRNMKFGPGAGVGTPLRAEFTKPQKFKMPQGPATTGSTDSPAVVPGSGRTDRTSPPATGLTPGAGTLSGNRVGRRGGSSKRDLFQAWFASQKKRNGR